MDPNIRIDGYTDQEWRLVSKFISEAQKEIRSEGNLAPDLDLFFQHVAMFLVSPNLSVKSARRAAGLSGNYSTKIFQITGSRPKEYIDRCKGKLAQRVLQHVNADIADVAFTLGFEEPAAFTRWYGRLFGYPPREETRNQDDGDPPRILKNVGEIDIELSPRAPRLVYFWKKIEKLNRIEIMEYLRRHQNEIDIAHFHFLLLKAKLEGRMDRQRGVDLTYSALDSLKLVEFGEGVEHLDEKAYGYANLSNACRLRFDLIEAQRAAKIADRLLPANPEEKPLLYGQVKFFEALLLWWQRHVEGALDLLKKILPLIREHGSSELRARSLLLCSEIYDSTGHPERALLLLREVVEFANVLNDTYILFAIHFNMTLVCVRLSMRDEAVEHHSRLRVHFEGQVSEHYLTYIDGLVARLEGETLESERQLLLARKGFIEQDLDIFGALVCMDLAVLYLDLGKHDEAFSAALGAIPLLSRVSHSEAIAALVILHEIEQQNRVNNKLIAKALYHLELVRKDPTAIISAS